MDTASKEKTMKYFTQIVASGKRLKVLLDDLLDLSKREAGKGAVFYVHLPISRLDHESNSAAYTV